jgi:hypothetical protein
VTHLVAFDTVTERSNLLLIDFGQGQRAKPGAGRNSETR